MLDRLMLAFELVVNLSGHTAIVKKCHFDRESKMVTVITYDVTHTTLKKIVFVFMPSTSIAVTLKFLS